MKEFLVEFVRKEFIHFRVKAKDRAEVKRIIENCEWDLEDESCDELYNEDFHIEEIK